MASILLVDDDITFTLILKKFLGKHHHHVDAAYNKKDALQKIKTGVYDLFLFDYRLPDGTGLDLFMEMPKSSSSVIMMTSFNDVRTAVKAMRLGVYEYITKPVNQEELLMIVDQSLASKQVSKPNNKPFKSPPIVKGKSEAYRKVHEQLELIAPTEMSVIIQGESGTGKEYIARQIHSLSNRAAGPFVAIDCGTLSGDLAGSELFGHVKGAFTSAIKDKRGRLEDANGGTLFLDEIGNSGLDVQMKLLRVLQEKTIQPIGSNSDKKIDVRLIAASNDDLWQLVQEGKFREDLYYRLNEFKMMVPPLRSRREDFPLFIAFFILESNQLLGKSVKAISKEVKDIFARYDWPGNIRELKNIIKRMVLLATGEIAEALTLPEEMILHRTSMNVSDHPHTDLKLVQESKEKELIEKALKEANFNRTKAARLLNIDRSTLYAKMEKYGIVL